MVGVLSNMIIRTPPRNAKSYANKMHLAYNLHGVRATEDATSKIILLQFLQRLYLAMYQAQNTVVSVLFSSLLMIKRIMKGPKNILLLTCKIILQMVVPNLYAKMEERVSSVTLANPRANVRQLGATQIAAKVSKILYFKDKRHTVTQGASFFSTYLYFYGSK